MNSLLNFERSVSSVLPIHITDPRYLTHRQIHTSLQFSPKERNRWIGRKIGLTVKAAMDSAIIDQLGLKESDIINPSISSSYRSSKLRKPNQTVLEAQARVCTGPTQTKPLSEEQAFKVLDTILQSGEPFRHLFSFYSLFFNSYYSLADYIIANLQLISAYLCFYNVVLHR